MRKVEKNYIKAPKILKSERSENHLNKIIESNGNVKAKTDIYRDKDVLSELDKIYFKKCGYCEKITNNYEIEHYSPKDKDFYPYLSYEWSNLFPVCHSCNKAKSNKFPVKERNFDINIRDINQLNKIEEPVVLNPEIDDPEKHFDFNIFTGEIIAKTKRATETIKICDLNSDDLIYFRKKAVDKIFEIIDLINVASDEIQEIVYKKITKIVINNKDVKSEFSMLWNSFCLKFEDDVLPLFLKEKKELMLKFFKKKLS